MNTGLDYYFDRTPTGRENAKQNQLRLAVRRCSGLKCRCRTRVGPEKNLTGYRTAIQKSAQILRSWAFVRNETLRSCTEEDCSGAEGEKGEGKEDRLNVLPEYLGLFPLRIAFVITILWTFESTWPGMGNCIVPSL